jgi:hypothetical protein
MLYNNNNNNDFFYYVLVCSHRIHDKSIHHQAAPHKSYGFISKEEVAKCMKK